MHSAQNKVADHRTTDGSSATKQTLIGETKRVDTFEIDTHSGNGVEKADLIFGVENSDEIHIGEIANSRDRLDGNTWQLRFDKNKDVTGDGQNDTVIHLAGEALAVIVGRSIDLTEDHFSQTEVEIVPGDFL